MKARLQTSLGQHLVLTPQLRQALHLLQLSALELEAEIAEAIESNPLLEWQEEEDYAARAAEPRATEPQEEAAGSDRDADGWDPAEGEWYERSGYDEGGAGAGGDSEGDDPAQRVAKTDSLQDHLSWQLHLGHLSPRDRAIGAALIDAIDEDGYLREPVSAIAEALRPDIVAGEDEIGAVLCQVQRLDPTGVGARDLGECLSLQLRALPADTPGRELALVVARDLIDRLPRLGASGLAEALHCSQAEADAALHLLRTTTWCPIA
jgi:RNA polymerase sigma-54 factor